MSAFIGSRLTIGVALLALMSQAATAANVTDVQGAVQLSRSGGAFNPVTGPTTCAAGDVVRALQNGSAQVVNPNGIIQTATPGNPVTCVAGPGPVSPAAGLSTGAVVGGTIALAAGVVGVVIATKKKNSASP